jgi:hypothetical protein
VKETSTYPLRLPRSLKHVVDRLSKQEGTSINQFVATAVAEKISTLETARFLTIGRIGGISRPLTGFLRRRGGERPGHAMKCQTDR